MSVTPAEPGFAVVAVDGSEEGYAAVEFAAKEAHRLGLTLRLAHVMPAHVPVGPPLMLGAGLELGAYASETLASAGRVVADVAPHVDVTTHLLVGGRVSRVVDLAQGARFIVVGRRPSRALDRAWSGGTLDGIVSRARCPVLVVPLQRTGAERPSRVVAGFKAPHHAAELFRAAFGTAEVLGAELEILHAWKLSSGYDDMIARRVSEASVNHDQKKAIWELVSRWQESYPDVRARVHVVHEYPVRALVDASREADRLVLGKPLHGSVVHHLGRTARGVLRFAECVVEVVPASPREEWTIPIMDLEERGELVP
jgi:nucleotide-binding universal stress UspA family protein